MLCGVQAMDVEQLNKDILSTFSTDPSAKYFTLPHFVHWNSTNFEKDQTTVPIWLLSQIMSEIHGL